MSDLFQLEILIDGKYVPLTQDTDIKLLVNQVKWRKAHPNLLPAAVPAGTGHRIFKVDRKRLKSGELAGGPKPAPKRPAPGVVDILRQAKLAAEWILKSGQKVIHVYPLGKSANHTSNQFRLYLFSALLGIDKTWRNDSDRIKSELLAREAGYHIIEVDPDEPALEEAA